MATELAPLEGVAANDGYGHADGEAADRQIRLSGELAEGAYVGKFGLAPKVGGWNWTGLIVRQLARDPSFYNLLNHLA